MLVIGQLPKQTVCSKGKKRDLMREEAAYPQRWSEGKRGKDASSRARNQSGFVQQSVSLLTCPGFRSWRRSQAIYPEIFTVTCRENSREYGSLIYKNERSKAH